MTANKNEVFVPVEGVRPFQGYHLFARGWNSGGGGLDWRSIKGKTAATSLPKGMAINTHPHSVVIIGQEYVQLLPPHILDVVREGLFRSGFQVLRPFVWDDTTHKTSNTSLSFPNAPRIDLTASVDASPHSIIYHDLSPEHVATAAMKAIALAYRVPKS